jgi:hypothetical protein
MHDNFTTCNRYIPLSTKNINLDFYQEIRLQNGVSMGMLISQSLAQRLTPKGPQWPNFGHCCFGQLGLR